MGAFAARKAQRVAANVRRVLAIELLAACQALEFLKPLETSAPLRAVYRRVRERVPAWERDRPLSPDIEAHSGGVHGLAFSPDGKRLVSGAADRLAKVWDAKTGKLVFTLEGHGNGVTSVAFNRDGSRIVSASGDRTLKLWDAQTGQLIRTFEGHESAVRGAAFRADGETHRVQWQLKKVNGAWRISDMTSMAKDWALSRFQCE